MDRLALTQRFSHRRVDQHLITPADLIAAHSFPALLAEKWFSGQGNITFQEDRALTAGLGYDSVQQSGTDALTLKIGVDVETIQLRRTFQIRKARQLLFTECANRPGG